MRTREVERERDAAHEVIADHASTIGKFRDLVAKVQEQNLDLRAALEKETNKPVSTPAEMIDFKKMFAESRAHSKGEFTFDIHTKGGESPNFADKQY